MSNTKIKKGDMFYSLYKDGYESRGDLEVVKSIRKISDDVYETMVDKYHSWELWKYPLYYIKYNKKEIKRYYFTDNDDNLYHTEDNKHPLIPSSVRCDLTLNHHIYLTEVKTNTNELIIKDYE